MPDRSTLRRRQEGGFTLIELLVTMSILGIVATSLSSAITVFLRNQVRVTTRIANSNDLQNLITWLPHDVNSAPPSGISLVSTDSSGCAGASGGSNVLLLTWTEWVSGVTTTYRVSYRTEQTGATIRLKRYYCTGTGGVGSLGSPQVLNVSNDLLASGPAPVAVAVTPSLIAFTLTEADGKKFRVDSVRKNPDETLPAVTSPVTTIAPTTTVAPTTTTIAPTTSVGATTTTTIAVTTTTVAATTTTTLPCVVTSITRSAATMKNTSNGTGAGPLKSDVIITITKTGSCQTLQLNYNVGGSNGLIWQYFPATAPFTVTLKGAPIGTELWTKALHALTVIDNNGVSKISTTLNVI